MSCESFELDISALVDGELAGEDMLATIDHLAACPTCRRFYHDVRRLDAVVGAARQAPPAEAAMWTRISRSSGLAARRPALPRWALAAAAAVAGAFGLLALLWVAGPLRGASTLDVALSSRSGAMTDRQFVRLTVALLEADPRYRRAMVAVLREVGTEADAEDGGADVWVAEELPARAESDATPASPRPAENEGAGTTRL